MDGRAERKRAIEAAALGVLVAQGYGALTMAAVARAAGASLETLYKWYGDKQGLFRAMVEANAADLEAGLALPQDDGDDPLAPLRGFGARLVAMLTSDAVVALNRAAAADPSGDLGAIIARSGRGTIAPQLAALFGRAMARGALAPPSPDEATEVYLGLLLGDLQIRRVVGRVAAPDAAEARLRSDRALQLLCRLWPAA